MRRLLARWFRRERLRPSVFAAVALVATAAGLALYFTDPFQQLELKTVDARFSIRGTEKPPQNMVVVGVTDNTFSELGFQWPFRRNVHARVLDRILRDKPRAVAFDVQFTEHESGPQGPADEQALATSFLNSGGKVVVAFSPQGTVAPNPKLFGSDATAADLGVRGAAGLYSVDPDGRIRHLPYSVPDIKGLAIVTAEVASGHRISQRAGGSSPLIDFYGPPGTVPSVDYARVYKGELPRGYFRGKIVIIGATAPTLQDLHDTAVGFNMSGPEIHAQAIGTILRGFPLRGASTAVNVLVILLMGLLAPLASIKLSFRLSVAVMLVAAAALTVGTQLAFNSGTVVTFVYPVTTLLLASVGALGGHYVLRMFEQVRVRELFSRFVPVAVVDEVISRTDDDLRLGGVRREGTVMFTDLRGFTTFAESLEPERVVEVINQYLSGMTEAILEAGGTLVAYMGDGIMALWGAPLEQPDHADRALTAAREMLAHRLPAFNAWIADEGYDHAFRMGIGLNTGSVMSGNVGSARRMEYTAIGDTTNTASRLEGMTKGTPHQLFVAETTRAALREVPDDLVFVDDFEIRGRQATLKVWTLAQSPAGEEAEASAAVAT